MQECSLLILFLVLLCVPLCATSNSLLLDRGFTFGTSLPLAPSRDCQLELQSVTPVTVIHSIASAQSRVATLHIIVLLVFLVVPVAIDVPLETRAEALGPVLSFITPAGFVPNLSPSSLLLQYSLSSPWNNYFRRNVYFQCRSSRD